ncbi:MAG: zinc ribbon domain-containing protein, partial [Anaerolineae bacterium]
DKYVKFKAARGIEAAAGTETGAAGAQIGMSIATGMAAGRVIADSFTAGSANQPGAAAPAAGAAAAAAATIKCPKCNTDNPVGAKFCNNCGNQLSGTIKCGNCGTDNVLGAKFCNNCGNKLQ